MTASFPTVEARRILAISDLHVDYKQNMQFVKRWKRDEYKNDALIIAGDVTDNMQVLESTLRLMKSCFAEVFFVPGNHELWIRPKEVVRDSIAKFKNILKLCNRVGVHTRPARVLLRPPLSRDLQETPDWQDSSVESSRSASPDPDLDPGFTDRDDDDDDVMVMELEDAGRAESYGNVWVVPLFSWYATPDDDLADTLYAQPKLWKEDPRLSDRMWMDNILCKWPSSLPGNKTRSQYFASMNDTVVDYAYDGPIISFSHVLPRQDLMMPNHDDRQLVSQERHLLGLGENATPKFGGAPSGFNFSRYAGSRAIERQVRRLGSTVHVFGHQHRNRDRTVDGVRYVQYCLGNCREQGEGWMYGLTDWGGPKPVWPPTHS